MYMCVVSGFCVVCVCVCLCVGLLSYCFSSSYDHLDHAGSAELLKQ